MEHKWLPLGIQRSLGVSRQFKNPEKRAYTWWPYGYEAYERNIGWRIDYILVSDGIEIKDCWIEKPEVNGRRISDHAPVFLEFDF